MPAPSSRAKYATRYSLMNLMADAITAKMPPPQNCPATAACLQSAAAGSPAAATLVLLNGHRDEMGAAVHRPSSRGVVVSDRPLLAVAHRSHTRGRDAAVEQVIAH